MGLIRARCFGIARMWLWDKGLLFHDGRIRCTLSFSRIFVYCLGYFDLLRFTAGCDCVVRLGGDCLRQSSIFAPIIPRNLYFVNS